MQGIHSSIWSCRFTSRVSWAILELVAVCGCVLISIESLQRYNTKNTVITLEKDHYSWRTALPSLTICPMNRLDKVKFNDYCRDRNIIELEKDELFSFLEALANSTYENFEKIPLYESVENLRVDPKEYMSLIYNLTEDLVQSSDESKRVVAVNNVDSIHTEQVLTEFGICYTTNNYLSEEISARYLIFGTKRTITQPEDGVIVHKVLHGNIFDGDVTYHFIGFNEAVTAFIHSPYEVMDIGQETTYARESIEYEATTEEYIASSEFGKRTTISQRKCRFTHESNLTHFTHVYTKNLCLQECRMDFALQKCGCIPHFYPNINAHSPVCDYKVLRSCFPQYKYEVINFRRRGGRKQLISCSCLQNCQYAQLIIGRIEVMQDSGELVGSIGGMMVVKKYPKRRHKRQILFTFTDLLVSIGGTAGFFLGFSVLGAVEVIWYFSLHLLLNMKASIQRSLRGVFFKSD